VKKFSSFFGGYCKSINTETSDAGPQVDRKNMECIAEFVLNTNDKKIS
jgi:hypothetical protein